MRIGVAQFIFINCVAASPPAVTADPFSVETGDASAVKKLLIVLLIIVAAAAICSVPAYYGARYAFNNYFEGWGNKLIDLENRGAHGQRYGA
jgi:hypothetical protein